MVVNHECNLGKDGRVEIFADRKRLNRVTLN
jgi:hypothetical protein